MRPEGDTIVQFFGGRVIMSWSYYIFYMISYILLYHFFYCQDNWWNVRCDVTWCYSFSLLLVRIVTYYHDWGSQVYRLVVMLVTRYEKELLLKFSLFWIGNLFALQSSIWCFTDVWCIKNRMKRAQSSLQFTILTIITCCFGLCQKRTYFLQ